MLAVVGVAVPQVPPAPLTDGVTDTPFAAAPPPLVTVKVMVTACPTSTVAALAATVAVKAEGRSTVMGVGRVSLAVSDAPLFTSDPVTVAPGARVPALEGVQVKVKVTGPPGVTVCGGAGLTELQIPEGVVATELTVAGAPPVSLTVSRAVTA